MHPLTRRCAHVRALVWIAAMFSLPVAASAQAPPTQSAPLDGTGWQLASATLAVPTPDATARITLRFEDGRVRAASGCNTGTAAYTLDAGTLAVKMFATTRMACTDVLNAWEAAFFAFLSSSPLVSRAGTDLTLTSGPHALVWRAVPVASAKAVTKFIHVAAERVPCTGVAPMMCLQVRDSPDQPWRRHHGEIIGFTHEAGIEYRLRILEDTVPNPPADASAIRWFLDLVVEQRRIAK